MNNNKTVDPLSVVPLYLECFFNQEKLANGTGFIIERNNSNFLITNWHVITGKDAGTGQPKDKINAAIPNKIKIWHHSIGKLGTWVTKEKELFDEDLNPRWIEHPNGKCVDVALLPISNHNDIKTYPLDLDLCKTDLFLSPSEPVSIIGFPFGVSSDGKFPIWKTGHIASDLDLNYDNKPVFLIDSTTRPGMSGSPVVARRKGIYKNSKGMNVNCEEPIKFLGIYSGRICKGSEIGMVWKPSVIEEILNNCNG